MNSRFLIKKSAQAVGKVGSLYFYLDKVPIAAAFEKRNQKDKQPDKCLI